MVRIDLNCDLGEASPGTARWAEAMNAESMNRESMNRAALVDPGDAALLDLVTSANVACGYHAGNRSTMVTTIQAATVRGVVIGAHPSYRDREGFGRREQNIGREELSADIRAQLLDLDSAAASCGGAVSYVKPHGALYNRIVWDQEQAEAVVDAVEGFAEHTRSPALPLLTLPGSVLGEVARGRGVPVFTEAFADRAYQPDGTLVPRSEPDAVLSEADIDAVAARVVAISRGEPIADRNGDPILVRADSVCVHGDTPGALEMIRHVRWATESAGVQIRSFLENEDRDTP